MTYFSCSVRDRGDLWYGLSRSASFDAGDSEDPVKAALCGTVLVATWKLDRNKWCVTFLVGGGIGAIVVLLLCEKEDVDTLSMLGGQCRMFRRGETASRQQARVPCLVRAGEQGG